MSWETIDDFSMRRLMLSHWLIGLLLISLALGSADNACHAQATSEDVQRLLRRQSGLETALTQQEAHRGRLLERMRTLVSQQAELERQGRLLEQELKRPLPPGEYSDKKCRLLETRKKQADIQKQISQAQTQVTLNQDRLSQVRQQLAQLRQAVFQASQQMAEQRSRQEQLQQQRSQQQRTILDQFMTSPVDPLGSLPTAIALGIGLGPSAPAATPASRFLAFVPMWHSGAHWRSGTPANEAIPFTPFNYTQLQAGRIIIVTLSYQFDVPPTSPAFGIDVYVFDNPFTVANKGGVVLGPSPATGSVTIPLTWSGDNQDLFIAAATDPALMNVYAWNATPTSTCTISNVSIRFNQ